MLLLVLMIKQNIIDVPHEWNTAAWSSHSFVSWGPVLWHSLVVRVGAGGGFGRSKHLTFIPATFQNLRVFPCRISRNNLLELIRNTCLRAACLNLEPLPWTQTNWPNKHKFTNSPAETKLQQEVFRKKNERLYLYLYLLYIYHLFAKWNDSRLSRLLAQLYTDVPGLPLEGFGWRRILQE